MNVKKLMICFNTIFMIAGTVLGSALTQKAVQLAYVQRGYMAIGGEWLVFLIVLLIFDFIRNIVQFIIRLIRIIKEDDKETAKIVKFQTYVKRQRR